MKKHFERTFSEAFREYYNKFREESLALKIVYIIQGILYLPLILVYMGGILISGLFGLLFYIPDKIKEKLGNKIEEIIKNKLK